MTRRWPLQALLDAARVTSHGLALSTGLSESTIREAHARGLSDLQADRWAVLCGLHPAFVWGLDWVSVKPRLLDLFCNAGGAGFGYHLAGFDVVGVEIDPHPDYPFTCLQADALTFPLDGFDVVHASPPCQAKTTMSNRWRGQGGKADSHVDLIAAVRARLAAAGIPYVIENVPGAIRSLRNPLLLTGGQFGLGVHRPRLFESNVLLLAPARAPAPTGSLGVYGKAPDGRLLWRRGDGTEQRAPRSVGEAQEAMGMPWCNDWRGIAEAIPPAYTRFIGDQLLAHLREAAA